MPTTVSTASWCSCPCRRTSTPGSMIDAIVRSKDVDGLHPINAGRLAGAARARCPCTPARLMLLLKRTLPSSGLEAVVVGRSELVGRPVAGLLLQADCTVTVAHSRTARPAAG